MALIDENGIAQTPDYASQLESIARKRKIAQAMSAMSMEQRPMQSGWELGGQLAQALSAGFQNRALDKQESAVNTGMNTAYTSTMEAMMEAMKTGDVAKAAKIGANSTDPRIAKTRETLLNSMLEAEKLKMENSGQPMQVMGADGKPTFVQPKKVGGPSAVELPGGAMPMPEKLGESGGVTFNQFTGAPVSQLPVNRERAAQAERTAAAGAARNNTFVNTGEKSYASQFAGKLADLDIATLDAAASAPELYQSSERILALLKKAPITGTLATQRAWLERAAVDMGLVDGKRVANTEQLVSELTNGMLAKIKSSGMGTGNGFTEKDAERLQQAANGTQSLSNAGLRSLAESSQRAARALQIRGQTVKRRVAANPATAAFADQIGDEVTRPLSNTPTRAELLAEAKRRGLTK